MDPVTHMMTGACLSRAGLNRKTGLATLTLTLALEAPDIDSFSYFGGGITGLTAAGNRKRAAAATSSTSSP